MRRAVRGACEVGAGPRGRRGAWRGRAGGGTRGSVALVIGWLVVVVLVVTAALAVYGIGITIANRPPGRPMRFAVGGTVALLAVQAVIAAVRVFSGVHAARRPPRS